MYTCTYMYLIITVGLFFFMDFVLINQNLKPECLSQYSGNGHKLLVIVARHSLPSDTWDNVVYIHTCTYMYIHVHVCTCMYIHVHL